jgi:hypothetical protein
LWLRHPPETHPIHLPPLFVCSSGLTVPYSFRILPCAPPRRRRELTAMWRRKLRCG